MSTYTGVIAASQKRCNCGAERLTDLFVQQQYMYLTSRPYALESSESINVAASVSEANLKLILHDTSQSDPIDMGASVQKLRMSNGIVRSEAEASDTEIIGAKITGLLMKSETIAHSANDTNDMSITGSKVTGLLMKPVLITHRVYEASSAEITGAKITGLKLWQ